MRRSFFIGVCTILLLSLWPQSLTQSLALKHPKADEASSVQNKNRRKRRRRARPPAQRQEVQTVLGVADDESGGSLNPPPPKPISDEDRERIQSMGPISGGVLNGKAISLPKPVYPAVAKVARASGKVTVAILIDEEGTVISAEAVAGPPLLRAAAVAAAREARFSRTLLSGVPVKVKGALLYEFIL